jgi:hypothetical protein
MNLRLLTTRPIQDLRQLVRQNHPLGRSYDTPISGSVPRIRGVVFFKLA